MPHTCRSRRRAGGLGEKAECYNLPRSLFQDSLFQLLLAFDAMPRPGHRFQTFGIDLLAAGNALSKLALAEPHQRALHHLQQLAVVIALMEEEFLGVRTCGTV